MLDDELGIEPSAAAEWGYRIVISLITVYVRAKLPKL